MVAASVVRLWYHIVTLSDRGAEGRALESLTSITRQCTYEQLNPINKTRLVKHTMDQYREQRACIYKQKQPPNSQCSTQDGNPHLQYAPLRDVLYGVQSLSVSSDRWVLRGGGVQ